MNDICNLAFIGGKTNRRISAKPPSEYLPPLIEKYGPGPFESQCIPTDESILEVTRYPDFLEERRLLVAARLNEFLHSARSR